jgi:hypothetical protein
MAASIRSFSLLGLVLAIGLCGCSKAPQGPPPSPEKLEEMRRARMKGIAEDKSLSDADAFKKYLESSPANPLGIPNAIGDVWAEVLPIGGGVPGSMITIRKPDATDYLTSKTTKDPLLMEREGIQRAALACEEMLSDLQVRNIKGISYQLYGRVEGAGYAEVFRATVLLKHLPKLQEAKTTPPDVGTVFDPRGPKINEIWIVEKNDYPKFSYNKK